MEGASGQISVGDEDNDAKIARRGNCRWVIVCGFGTKLCRQANVRHEECREIAISRGRAPRFNEFRFSDPRV